MAGTRFEQCLAENRAVYTPDLTLPPFPQRRTLVENGILSDVLAPIQSESEVIGALAIGRATRDAFTEDERAFVEAVSVHLAPAIRKARMFDELRRAYEDLKKTQRQIIQQERLKAMGTMASGIAHDFNNLLMGILGYSELLDVAGSLPENTREYVRNIEIAAQDAARLVARLREFYRPQDSVEVLGEVKLDALIEQALTLTMPRWRSMAMTNGAEIRICRDMGNIPDFLGYGPELRDMLTNLILNAADAMPKGGTLTIRTRHVPSRPVRQNTPSHSTRGGNGKYSGDLECRDEVTLEVIDTGIGMSDDVRERCLEPFFSTKGRKGTGLGLAMVYGAVQRHNGVIEIDSKLGQGTTFRIRLSVDLHRPVPVGAVSLAHVRQLRALIVDDEPYVRDVVSGYLKADGHAVTTAENGVDALDKFLRDRFDLVLTDKGMPKLSGDQLAERLQGLAPDVPVILLTGWGASIHAHHRPPIGVRRVLSKPVTRDQLRMAIAEVIREDKGSQCVNSEDTVLSETIG
jgi:signal transduction histidine kinase/CheY-like chemotaxis protein